MTEINGEKPYENSGLEEGDMIVEINQETVSNSVELISCVNKCNGESVTVTYIRDGIQYNTTMVPVKANNDEYKLGLWVRDGAAGIGTMTYYEPTTGEFASLGHGIVDADTEDLITVSSGEVLNAQVNDIKKGEKGTPGELKGIIKGGEGIGSVEENTDFGIYGQLTDTTSLNINESNTMEVALRNEIEKGNAKILLTLQDGIRKEYDIKITKIYENNDTNNKSMMIEITDEELLSLTGGIVQGMSGAPIIQNGKFIGAVTHVLVSDPTKGYAVFGDLMIKEMRN